MTSDSASPTPSVSYSTAPPSTTSLDDLDDAGPITIHQMDEDDESPLRRRPSQRGKGKGGDARARGGGGEGEDSGGGGSFKGGGQSSNVKPSTSPESVGCAKGSADYRIFKGLLKSHLNRSVPELLHENLCIRSKQLSEKKGLFAGCTAVVAFIQVEVRESVKKSVASEASVEEPTALTNPSTTGLLCHLLRSDPDKDITGWSENDRGVNFILVTLVSAGQVCQPGVAVFRGDFMFGEDVDLVFGVAVDLCVLCDQGDHHLVITEHREDGQKAVTTAFDCSEPCDFTWELRDVGAPTVAKRK
ncbi:hypothetical protein HDV00_006534 [Rhizophlyctis rosea]|nr:hypothetical protein HDV00_006534 [Rhizophlyctis rosea]